MTEPQKPASPSQLLAAFTAHESFRDLDEATLGDLQSHLTPVTLSAGEALFHQDEPGDSMYVLARGNLDVTVDNEDGSAVRIDRLGPGASVGEMALLSGQPRTATVTAGSDAQLVCLTRAGFEALAQEHPQLISEFTRSMIPRWQRAQLAGVLSGLFGDLGAQSLIEYQKWLQWRHLSTGEVLFHQGEEEEAMYVVVNGRLRYEARDEDGHVVARGEAGPGQTIGEFALFSDEPRSATVQALRESNVVRLDRTLFQQMVQSYPQAMMEVTRIIVDRRRRSLKAVGAERSHSLNFALVPLHPDAPVQEVAQHLAQTLRETCPTLHLNVDSFDGLFGREGAAQTEQDDPLDLAIDGWFSEQEARYRYLLCQAEPTWSAWTRRCLDRADRILFVADARSDPMPGHLEEAVDSLPLLARKELILIHPPQTERPTGTARWLEPRGLYAHHHVQLDDPRHLRRLARRLTGRTVGLVLGGGGARGFAHIGAIRALEEAGVAIDRLGGTSIGAIIAAGYARDMSAAEMNELARTFASPRKLNDYTFPISSLNATAKVTRVLKSIYGELQVEDLWRPYFAISSNLTTSEPFIYERGPLWKGVRMSMSIPGIYAPVLHQGHVHVDGAAMDHLPIDVMRDYCEGGTVIAIDVSPRKEKQREYDFGPSISGWRVLRSRLNPLEKAIRVPSLYGIVMRTIHVNSTYRLKTERDLADALIEPPVARFGTLQFEAYEEIIETGYQAAREQAPAIAALIP